MAQIPRTPDDLEKSFEEQLNFLTTSAQSYDSGNEIEAKRLAVHIRIMVHDSRTSISLIKQLGLKDILFYDTAGNVDPSNLLGQMALVMFKFSPPNPPKYVPKFDDSHLGEGQLVTFDKWWNKPIFMDREKNALTRKELVLAIANKDGGAHVDPELDEIYAKLSRYNSLGWNVGEPSGEKPLLGAELAAVRQIAHELVKSLRYKKKRHSERIVNVSTSLGHGATMPTKHQKIGRNDPCPCSSGKKYKRCHGNT